MKYVALCDSEECAFKMTKVGVNKSKITGKTHDRMGFKYLGPQQKNVPKTTVCCPDCGSALFWTAEAILSLDRKRVG